MEHIFLSEVNSTQDFIKDKLKSGEQNIVVSSDIQNSGRGRSGHSWESPRGGLWFSFDCEYVNPQIPIIIGVAIKEVCEEYYPIKLLLKWPNDVILDGKKVAGILCERIFNRVIIGVGINTNVNEIDAENSISFLSATNKTINNKELMDKIIDKFFHLIIKEKDVINKFRNNMAFIGEKRFISALNKEATILGISDEGHLIVSLDGKVKDVSAGEIFL